MGRRHRTPLSRVACVSLDPARFEPVGMRCRPMRPTDGVNGFATA